VLLVLSLVYFLYLDKTDFAERTKWIVGAILLAGILAQSGGFFVHSASVRLVGPQSGRDLRGSALS
jgi:hypothetical protein